MMLTHIMHAMDQTHIVRGDSHASHKYNGEYKRYNICKRTTTMNESVLSKFNATVVSFVEDLKIIFGENDRDILAMEAMCDMVKINARLILSAFQTYIVGNPIFVKNINEQNIAYFLDHNFDDVIDPSVSSDYSNKLVAKFKEATRKHKDDAKTMDSIFNWFKVMIYFALVDDNKDPVSYIKKVCESVDTANDALSLQ